MKFYQLSLITKNHRIMLVLTKKKIRFEEFLDFPQKYVNIKKVNCRQNIKRLPKILVKHETLAADTM